jgi:hypothetical protein
MTYALSGSFFPTLVSFNPAGPADGTSIPVTGLTAGQTLVGIDVRPANGLLYGLGVNAATDAATLYTISVLTGVATIVGSFNSPVVIDFPASADYGFDFNPVVDRIRVTTDTGLNFRINPNNGSLAGLDPMIVGSEISGVAYTNNETHNSGLTTLYTLDPLSDQLMIQGFGGNPNGGIQTAVGSVGVDFSTVNGFDIPPGVDTLVANAGVPSGSGLALLTVGGTVQLYIINLATGAGTLIGNFLDGITPASGLAILNPSPPPATSANMVLRHSSGQYEIYNLGNNAVLAASWGLVGTDWGSVKLGGFNDGNTSDMLLRNSTSGAFQVYNIAPNNNNITGSTSLGTVGLEWQVLAFGNFDNVGNTDMILRNVNTAALQVYNITNNQITGSNPLGAVGVDWQFSGVGNFSSIPGESDMILRNVNTGVLEIYNIAGNQLMGASFLGTVGVEWQFSGVGNFSSIPGESDMILRNANTGTLLVYDIANNQITGASVLGTVGLDWQFAGVAPIHAPGASDLVLRNVSTGQFQVYNIANNQITSSAPLGTVGTEWQLSGFAPSSPTGATGGSDGSTSQLVQAMAGFGGDAADDSNDVFVGADTSQQTFLTTPQA